MSGVFAGRYMAEMDDDFVVFLIGMRVNKFWQFSKWIPVARAMPPMLETLSKHPKKGLLGFESFFSLFPMTTCLVSYWRSFEDLEYFATNRDDPHLAVWRDFNQQIGTDGTVGIWHETYQIRAGEYECIYGNMPSFGLAKATKHVPVGGKRETARSRIGRDMDEENLVKEA